MLSRSGLLLPALLGLAGSLPTAARAQTGAGCWAAPTPIRPDDADRTRRALELRVLRASRLRGPPPAIDGRLDEAEWCRAEAAGDLVQSRPAPGALASLPTSIRVLYDDDAVYVALRLFDDHPDSIVAPFPRRDDETTSDWVFVEVDTRFDRRGGYSFGLNPRGVQADGSWSNDVSYDGAWNGVWQGAASIDAGGWTAEIRIPYSQVALGLAHSGAALTWGFNVYRHVPHRGETANWSPRLPSASGIVSRFNQLRGLVVPPRRAAWEAIPYGSLTMAAESGRASGAAALEPRAGLDLRLRPTASTALSMSLHPDFGQVEADPSQVNLTTFETFFPEQRPLFVEGAETFQADVGLDFASRGGSFADDRLFYSRRIGAPPHGRPPTGAGPFPTSTPVLGAARFAGRSERGWSGGLLQAWTGPVRVGVRDSTVGLGRRQVEPTTGYTVGRVTRELAGGDAGLGGMLTAVNRFGLSPSLDSILPRGAYVVGSEGRRRFGRGRYEVRGFALLSRLEGSASAIAGIKADPRHGYGRPATLTDEPSVAIGPTTLTGASAQAQLMQLEGRLQWSVAGRAVTRGFEANDAGFQRNADWLLLSLDWKYQRYRPGRWLSRWSVGSTGTGIGWTTAGSRRAARADLTLSGDLASYWGGSLSLDHELPVRSPELLRGGPALRLPAREGWAVSLYSDTRRAWQVTLDAHGAWERATDSRAVEVAPGVTAFVTDRLQIGLNPLLGFDREGWQYVGQPRDSAGRIHYLVGRLRQTTGSLTARATYAFSPHLTVQLYGQAFLSGGRYDRFAEVAAPEAGAAADRVAVIEAARLRRSPAAATYTVDADAPDGFEFADPAFSERALHLNLLVRWEFLPGSTIFLVWTQERLDRGVADFSWGRDLRRLARAPAANALQIKATYWLSR